MSTISFRADAAEAGGRVDAVVARRAGLPRAAVQEAIRAGGVTVGGRSVRPSHRLEPGDEVAGEVDVQAARPPQAEHIPVTVVYSDQRLLVISKPAGLVVHPAGGHATGTLVNALLALGEPLAGAGSERPGIVHRLDKETSGLLLVAKDDDAHAFLTSALKTRRVRRVYCSLVRGQMRAESGTIEAPIARHPKRRDLMAVVPGGRFAVTHYRVIEATSELSLLEVTLETGRTHQIRVHLSHLGHPVVGDRLYGGRSDLSGKLGLVRPFLHASRLAFPHPDDERLVELADRLPADLLAALEAGGLSQQN